MNARVRGTWVNGREASDTDTEAWIGKMEPNTKASGVLAVHGVVESLLTLKARSTKAIGGTTKLTAMASTYILTVHAMRENGRRTCSREKDKRLGLMVQSS